MSRLTVYVLLPFSRKKKYTKRFYRRVLRKRYDRVVPLLKGVVTDLSYVHSWRPSYDTRINFKSYFHIKTIFNLDEFLLYDFYNYHNQLLKRNFIASHAQLMYQRDKPWKKLNFFYQIKYSIDVFRTHTLQFFKASFRTDRKATVFLKGFRGLSTLAYVWFFEYSLPYFLVKIRLAESVSQGLALVRYNSVFLNHEAANHRWESVHPGFVVQFVLNLYTIVRVKFMILKFLNFFKRIKRFFKRTLLKPRKYRIKMPSYVNKSAHLVNSKHMHLRIMEVDYKSLTFVLLPYNNPTIYFKYLTLFWLNF